MARLLKDLDWIILVTMTTLVIMGLVMIYSVAPQLLLPQVGFALIGLLGFFSLFQTNYQTFKSLGLFFYLVVLVLFVLLFVFGTRVRGSVRWIEVGNFHFQPSEFAKPLLVLVLAWFISRKDVAYFENITLSLLLVLVPTALVFKEPDLGSAFILLSLWTGMVVAGGAKLGFLALGALVVGASFLPLWRFLKDYQKARLLTFLNPNMDPLGTGYNAIQAMIAVGSGQIFGRGLGRGTQSHLRFLPEQHTDFIFATLAEETGLLGSLVLIGCYFLLVWRIFKIGESSADFFGALVCLGVGTQLLVQVFINVGMNVGAVPITGVTLPLVSYGGSSLVSTMVSLGLVESVVKRKKPPATIDIR